MTVTMIHPKGWTITYDVAKRGRKEFIRSRRQAVKNEGWVSIVRLPCGRVRVHTGPTITAAQRASIASHWGIFGSHTTVTKRMPR